MGEKTISRLLVCSLDKQRFVEVFEKTLLQTNSHLISAFIEYYSETQSFPAQFLWLNVTLI